MREARFTPNYDPQGGQAGSASRTPRQRRQSPVSCASRVTFQQRRSGDLGPSRSTGEGRGKRATRAPRRPSLRGSPRRSGSPPGPPRWSRSPRDPLRVWHRASGDGGLQGRTDRLLASRFFQDHRHLVLQLRQTVPGLARRLSTSTATPCRRSCGLSSGQPPPPLSQMFLPAIGFRTRPRDRSPWLDQNKGVSGVSRSHSGASNRST